MVFDNVGNLYIAASGNRSIRRVDTNGIITTIAGTGEHGYSGDGGPAVRAQLAWTRDVAVDDNGNVYIADYSNARIRRVDARGIITTIAGTGEHDYSGDGGPAVQAQLRSPEGVAVDRAGNLLIADTNNNRIRRVDARGGITTLVGGGIGGDHGPAVQAQLKSPVGVAVDGAGNLLIADSENYRIRRVDSKGIITTIAGTGALGFTGDHVPAVAARISRPFGVALDRAGSVFISDSYNNRIRRVDARGVITTVAGTGMFGYGGDNGPAIQAELRRPYGVAVDNAGNLYVADQGNNRVRRVNAQGIITTVAGNESGVTAGTTGRQFKRSCAAPLAWQRTAPATSFSPMARTTASAGWMLREPSSPSQETAMRVTVATGALRSRRNWPLPLVWRWTTPATSTSPISPTTASAAWMQGE